MAPGTREPSAKISVGVPVILCFLPNSRLRATAAASKTRVVRGGVGEWLGTQGGGGGAGGGEGGGYEKKKKKKK